ncbi:helix-turn-helix domain-containing protein [Actinokineospora spheciospongiae]|uniref:helix-turn-helix domain-containing protein n=1 Tax=Actinokineospora spheciospongiae TaxID=909613 RepID=UPI000D904819|nr:helix-turn-helix domain-containing protein [Actinokineospora spheciospongiae]PWW50241.1 hypothetical protein DFQ13_1233 [Actinokineospora spheciospongiae]
MLDHNPVLNVRDAATRARRHEKTILGALRAGELVGHQRVSGGTWSIFQDDLDRWIRGEKPTRAARAGRRR